MAKSSAIPYELSCTRAMRVSMRSRHWLLYDRDTPMMLLNASSMPRKTLSHCSLAVEVPGLLVNP